MTFIVSNEDNTILVVDDNPANLAVLTDYLDEAGFDTRVAQDGESAIQKVEFDRPDLILLDIMMPGIDGFETCRRLKSNTATTDIPIIFMSALSDTLDKVTGLELGAVDYITKPFQQEEVMARIKLHLKMQSLAKALESQNVMLQQEIGERTTVQAALQQLTKDLEQKVSDRTAKLSESLHELKQAQAQLAYDAFHDSVTDLPNRAWLMQRLKFLIANQSEPAINSNHDLNDNSTYAVLFIDIDRFKVINDSLGHLVGDQLLKHISLKIQEILPPAAQISRFGGDEFVVLLEQISDLQAAIAIADQIQALLQLPLHVNNCELFIGASIGIVLGATEYDQPEDILRDADLAMYQAKNRGRGRCEIFDLQVRQSAIARLNLETSLRYALERQEFCLYYQPIVCLQTRILCGFEALIRWRDALGAIISPFKFITVAEEIGLINPLGDWILREACQQTQIWRSQFQEKFGRELPLWINVNVSPIQLKQIGLSQNIKQILAETGLPGTCLKLEITESCLLETFDIGALDQIRNLGIRLCIDDFGTGYSSLSRLHELPIDSLKIDRAFVTRLGSEVDSSEIIKTILTLAQSLNMTTVAEGIETEFQLEKLSELGCQLGQGYLFAQPCDLQTSTQLVYRSGNC